jgi:hypothetical protein
VDGLAAVGAPANFGGRDVAVHVFEQIYGTTLKMRDDLRGMRGFGFFFGVGTSHGVGGNDQAQGFGTNTGAIGDDEIAEAEKRFVFLPHRDVEESVGADDEEDAIAVAVVGVAEVAHGVDGIVELGAAEVFAGFGEGWDEMRMLGGCERDHRKTMWKWGEVLFQFVRRAAGGDEMDLVEVEASVCSARDGQVTIVNRIERSAEKTDAAGVMLGGGAVVGLRGGQCVSRDELAMRSPKTAS